MKYSFHYNVRPANLWILSMINTYRSMVGVVNIVFTLSMIMLTFRFWMEANMAVRLLMIAGIMVFPCFQPLVIFLRSSKIVGKMPVNMHLDFDNKGMKITAENLNAQVNYTDLKSVIEISGMLVLYTQARQGYILNREVLGNKEKELFDFLTKKVRS